MKTTILTIMIITGLIINAQEKPVYKSESSSVEWFGYKTGGEHHGTIEIKSASFSFNENGIPEKGKVVIDMNSIVCLDLDNKTMNSKLVNHLKSSDFFEVEKYPEAIYRITSAELLSNGKVKIDGLLTIKNKTNPYQFEATLTETENEYVYNATLTISRGDYYINVEEGANLVEYFKDSMIKEHFKLNIKLVFKGTPKN